MAKVDIKYPSGRVESTDFGYLGDAIKQVRRLFQNSAVASMAGGFITLKHNGKGKTFHTDGGIGFSHWEDNAGGQWGSHDEFVNDIG